MAVSLKARISLVDKFSAPMRKVERQVERNQRALDNMRRKANQTGTAMDKMNHSSSRASTAFNGFGRGTNSLIGGLGSLVRSLNPVALGFAGLAAGATAAYGAVKIFNATVGEAMKMQQSQFVITAMFDDDKLSADYMKLMDKIAIKSPLLDSQTMYGNSKSFITASKDLGQLEKMWSLAERLVASDPQQGLEGAIYALRELFSGDSKSIVERFEMPRKIMKDIKNLPLKNQLSELDKYFNKIGLSTGLIDKMGSSALGMWSQVKERFQLIMRDMGEPSVKVVSEFLGGIMDRLESEDMKKFANWGGRVIENMLGGLTNNAIRLYDWFTALANSEEFKSKSTLFGKVDFIVSDIADKLQTWYDNGGKDKIMKFGSNVTETLLAILNNSQAFIEVGVNLGNSLAAGIMQGIENSAKSSKLGKFLSVTSKASFGVFGYADDIWKTGKPIFNDASKSLDRNLSKSHSAGLDRVPYNGYQPVLHKDEKILNAQEAREYRKGGKGGGVTISGNTFHIREEADINKVAMALARILEVERGQTA